MKTILIISAYLVYAAFLLRLILHALTWFITAKKLGIVSISPSFTICGLMTFDLFLFRRLFRTNKFLWFGSWTFHACLFLIVLRHLKYFMEPVPGWITHIQPLGMAAGYVLPLSLAYTLFLRLTVRREKYVSYYNLFLMGLLLLISATGLLMNTYFMVDVADVKEFILGLLAFKPAVVPESFIFISHFLMALLLILYLPFHIFTAPITIIEARRREEGLKLVMHEK